MSDTATFNEDQKQIWHAVREMLDGFLAGDRPRIDQHINVDCTIWDSSEPDMAFGLAGLNAVRDRRPPSGDQTTVKEIESLHPVIDVFGDFGICRHWLVVHYTDGRKSSRVRNTGVWRKFPQGWQVIHNHEDELAD